jgi:hypothetical protein
MDHHVRLNRKRVEGTALPDEHLNRPFNNSATAVTTLASRRGHQVAIHDHQMSPHGAATALQYGLQTNHLDHHEQPAEKAGPYAIVVATRRLLQSFVGNAHRIDLQDQLFLLSGIMVQGQILPDEVTERHRQISVMVVPLVETNSQVEQIMSAVHKIQSATSLHSCLVHKPAVTLIVDGLPFRRAVLTGMNGEVRPALPLLTAQERPELPIVGLILSSASDGGRKQRMRDALRGDGTADALETALCFAPQPSFKIHSSFHGFRTIASFIRTITRDRL